MGVIVGGVNVSPSGVDVEVIAGEVAVIVMPVNSGDDVWVIGLGRKMDSSGGLMANLIVEIKLSIRQDNRL